MFLDAKINRPRYTFYDLVETAMFHIYTTWKMF